MASAPVGITFKKTEPGTDDEYRGVAMRTASSGQWTQLSANFAAGWEAAPTELVLYFESPDLRGGQFANILVDDVSVRVLSSD